MVGKRKLKLIKDNKIIIIIIIRLEKIIIII